MAGGKALAESTATKDTLKYLRSYPVKRAVRARRRLQAGQPRRDRHRADWRTTSSPAPADKLFADRLLDMFTGKETGRRQRRC